MSTLAPKVYTDIYPFLESKNFTKAHVGKTLLITGAGRGIGQQIARRFSAAGVTQVAVVDLALSNLEETTRLCEAEGAKVYPLECDVSDAGQARAMVKNAVERLGHVDILINCAGVCHSKPLFLDNFDSIWTDLQVNLAGPLLTMMEVLPLMKARGSGCIINIVSRAGTVTVPYLAGYSISKCALIKATECFQKDIDTDGLGDRIQIYGCHPGAVQTDLSKRSMDPEVAKQYPHLAENRPKWVANFNTSPALCAAVCVFLATGAAKNSLRGRYIDCEHDMEAFLSDDAKKDIINNEKHILKVEFLGGLRNDGGGSKEVFKFD